MIKLQEQMENSFDDLIETIHFTEQVTTKIHGLRDVSEILQTINEEFANSPRYVATILFLSEDGTSLQVASSSLSASIVKAMEKAAGLFLETYRVELEKSSIFRKVAIEGQTIQCFGVDILAELLPGKIAAAVTKLIRVGKEPSILTPLYSNGDVMGVLTMTSPVLSEHFLPSVRNLAQHISMALELADEYSGHKHANEALNESEERYRTLVENAGTPITCYDLDGNIRLINNIGAINLGGKPEDFVGRSLHEVIPDIALTAVERMRKIAESGMGREYEDLVVLPSRNYWLRSNMLPVKDTNEKIDTVLVISQDITERKKVEEALKDSEARFKDLFESANDAIIHLNKSGIVIDANRQLEGMFGTKLKEIIGKNFSETAFVKKSDMSAISGQFDDAVKTGEIQSLLEIEVRRRDGHAVNVEASTSLAKKDGKVEGALVILRDITIRKQAVEALTESEGKWRSLAENVPDIITTVDRNGMIVFANHAAHGIAPNRAIGTSFYDYVSPEYREITQRSIDRVFAIGNPVDEYEAIGNNPHGSTRWYACRVGPVKQGEDVVAVNLVATDITDRKNSEEEIMQRNRELNALNAVATMLNQSLTLEEILNNALDKILDILNIENAGVTLLDGDSDSMVLEVHRGISGDLLEAISRLRLRGGIMGRVVQLGEPMFIESLPDSLELLAGKAYKRIVTEQQLKSVLFVPLQVRGKVLGLMCAISRGDRVFTPEERELFNTIGQAISTAVENAQLLDEASRAEALEELDRLRTELLASVSHELRTPLTAIKGIAGTLVQQDIEWDIEMQRDFLKTIDLESDKLTHIVEDLMAMSQLEAGVLRLDKKKSRISTVVSQLKSQIAACTRNHILKVSVPNRLPVIYIDEIRIGEVITNLVANAAAYSEEGTCITLEAGRIGGDIVISVSDDGIGIKPDHIEKVFDRFYRLESGIARRRGGTGLGLSICKGIVEAHEGQIWVESKPGEGSKFSFSLPTMDKTGA